MSGLGIKRFFSPIQRPNNNSAPNEAPSPELQTPRKKKCISNPSPSIMSPIMSPKLDSTTTSHVNKNDDIQHPHLTYSFLYPPERMDIEERLPSDPDYDEKTLHVPTKFLNSQTPALRQWWLLKQKNMDAILFFKMGKFYELFNDDAVLGVKHLDIAYMKGDETKPAHAGFPEISFEKYSKILIEKGFKVIRVEQTETPAMMEERCQATGNRGKFDKVVKREICQITTKGTQMLGVMESVFHSSQNQYLLAICESDQDSDGGNKKSITFGVCFVDVTISKLYLGQFKDDNNLSKLNILLAHHTPTEILYERGNINQETYQSLLRTGAQLTSLKPNKEFWPPKRALSHLKTHRIFLDEQSNSDWPQTLKELFDEGDSSESLLVLEPKDSYKFALNSFGAIVYYLQSQLIAEQVLKCCSFELYCTPFDRNASKLTAICPDGLSHLPPMIMDHIALGNLEIFQNSSGGTESTLFDSINQCKTHFGQRLLKNWLCAPLCDRSQIENRLEAVQALICNSNASLMNEISHVLSQTPDLERMLSKIKSQCFKSESDARAIMFDGNQYSKAKIISFMNLMQNFRRLKNSITSVSKSVANCDSHVLRRLLTFTTDGGLYPDYSSTLEYFENSFDADIARKTGKIIPSPGVDRRYDYCNENIENMKKKLEDYLEEQKDVLRCRKLEYFGTAKNRFQIQVPDEYCNNVPSSYRIETTRKGVKRYYTTAIDKMFQKLTVYEEEMKKTLDSIMSNIFEQFSRKITLWSAAIECIAIVDVLQSIASFVRSLKAKDVDVCCPKFIDNQDLPLISYTNGRHPALVKVNPCFIPNDLKLDNKCLLLSGANMGGKSTLMRQTALLVVLAQIGCFVPASDMVLTPVDRIFSRLGASDRLLEGESTFYVELVETSAMLQSATRDSLILLDELGRGTSTYDGTAIAYSVLKEICKNIRSRCLFSTHYHTLVRDFSSEENVRLAHMACKIEKDTNNLDSDPLKENITFLYKITDGPVGRSYGFNVAKLAGIDDEIIEDAFKKSIELELSCKVVEILQKMCIDGKTITKSVALKEQVVALL